VVFSLDGVEAATDDDPPFLATLDLGSPASPHEISAVALSASGTRLAADSITVNQTGALFTVDITDVEADAAGGTYSVTAEISVPPADRLERVEYYWNESLQQTLTSPPWRATFTAPAATPEDYLRVVAHLAGGDSLEDVRLLAQGPVEEVEVNLVELYVVATDPNGVPVEGLERDDFTIFQGKRTREIERFDLAEDVPLVMGLVVDTSGSMWALMQETKMAAAQFLGNSLTEGDSAFLVDFSTRPRLAHPQTGDLLALVRAFSTLQPAGYTALYDSIVFTMLQFEEGRGRKAIVLLTDGEDVSSRFGPKRCIEYGQRLGIPVYIVALGGPGNVLRRSSRNDLENITEKTGGRVFYIADMSELPAAYEQINAELRSQYLLAFATEEPLELEELRELEVVVDDPAIGARTVVGGQQLY
jgi:VWFA-related protein